MSKRFKKLPHTIYECKYHFAICPKYRFRIFKGGVAEYTKQQTYIFCSQKDLVEVLELSIQVDHIHLVMTIPPKYSVSSIMGFLKKQVIPKGVPEIRKSWEEILGAASVGQKKNFLV